MSYIKKFILFFVALTLVGSTLFAQFDLEQPVKWSPKVVHLEGNEYEIQIIAKIAPDWHTYDLGPYKDGPNPTIMTLSLPAGVIAVGEPYVKVGGKKEFDSTFGMEIGHIEDGDIIAQKVKNDSKGEPEVEIYVEWQACTGGSCIPPEDASYKVKLPAADGALSEATVDAAASEEKGSSLWGFILGAIGWGLMALLTPCVFPMIPMTVSFFLKQNEKSPGKGKFLASLYGICIVLIYTVPIAIIILLTYIIGGDSLASDIFNWLATSWINVLFFLIFLLFAFSFFGAFEITMPSWMVNKADTKSSRGGVIGVFFMALTLVLVSFSCTGPIVGSAIIRSMQGEIMTPIIVMLVFSIVFAIPFTIFAFAPSLLNKLPKSGGWLNSVKVVLGFIELALGMKFLSVADQTYHWGLLDREVYLAFWIVIAALLGLYLL
ncbi:MAG: thiol:disulfide interchange protein, partial [Bacteroidales bacterium]|nr:thiol:disulfide interchange protein [Bacteroidales bacterium]